jgi:serine/threonine-protein kinase
VAIKALRDLTGKGANAQARARLLREARAAGSIRHPNVVDVYDVLDSPDGPLLVMELLEGESLQALMGRGPLPTEDVFRILIPAMRGVAAAHQKGVVHRDLKPDNIFLLRNSRGSLLGVKVLDFGISKVARDPLDEGHLTQSGTILGTPAYMAPEQLTAGEIDPRTDVYTLGVIAYEALTGSLPHEGETFALMATAKLSKNHVPVRKRVPSIPRGLAKVLDKALARDKASRYQNVAELAWALEPYTDVGFGAAVVQLSSETGRSAVVTGRSHLKTWLAIGVVGLLVATGTVLASIAWIREPAEVVTPLSTEAEVESVSESGSEAETETATETESETESDSETEAETAAEAGSAAEPDRSSRRTRRRRARHMQPPMGRSGTLSESDF